MNYLSFSLWGDKPLYNVGILKNAELIKEIYPDWKMVVYYDNTALQTTIEKLLNVDALCINMSNKNIYGMFWRFFAADLDDAEYVVFRDADSRVSIREKMAVDEWIKSGRVLHVMRDHPYHRIPCGNDRLGILGGMWGIKSKKISITELIENYPNKNNQLYGEDQSFLKKIYDLFHDDKFTHDEFFEINPFPIKRENGRFVGERIDEHDNPLTDDYKIII